MKTNQNLKKEYRYKISSLGIKLLYYSITLQILFTISLIAIILKVVMHINPMIYVAVISLIFTTLNWYKLLLKAIKIQEFTPKANKLLITAFICPYIINIIFTSIFYFNINNMSDDKILYKDLIKYNTRTIEGVIIELEEDLKDKKINKKEYNKKLKEIKNDIQKEFNKYEK